MCLQHFIFSLNCFVNFFLLKTSIDITVDITIRDKLSTTSSIFSYNVLVLLGSCKSQEQDEFACISGCHMVFEIRGWSIAQPVELPSGTAAVFFLDKEMPVEKGACLQLLATD